MSRRGVTWDRGGRRLTAQGMGQHVPLYARSLPVQYAAMVDHILFILKSASPPLQLFFLQLPYFLPPCARSSPMDNYPTPKRPATDASRTTAAGAALLTPGSARPAVTPNGLGRSPLQATPGSTCTLFNARANASSARIYLLGKYSRSMGV